MQNDRKGEIASKTNGRGPEVWSPTESNQDTRSADKKRKTTSQTEDTAPERQDRAPKAQTEKPAVVKTEPDAAAKQTPTPGPDDEDRAAKAAVRVAARKKKKAEANRANAKEDFWETEKAHYSAVDKANELTESDLEEMCVDAWGEQLSGQAWYEQQHTNNEHTNYKCTPNTPTNKHTHGT